MAVIVEFKPKLQTAGDMVDSPVGKPFTLLFFTGVQYERISDETPSFPCGEKKEQRKMARRPHQRLKA